MKKDTAKNLIVNSKGFFARWYMRLAYIAVFAVVIVLSLFQIGFDFEQLQNGTFWGNLCINYALAIISMILAMMDGEKKRKDTEEFHNAYKNWIEKVKRVCDQQMTTILDQYLIYRIAKDQEAFNEEIIVKNCIKSEWLNLTIKELKRKKKELNITNDQLAVIKKLQSGFYTIKKIRSVDLLNADRKAQDKFSYDVTLDKTKYAADIILPKLVLMFITTAIIASVVFDIMNNPGKAVGNLVMRLFNVIVSIVSGYLAGFTLTGEQINALNNKSLLIDDFFSEMSLGTFVPDLEEEKKLDVVERSKVIVEIEEIKKSPSEEDEYEIVELTAEEAEQLKNQVEED